jgi:ABC-type phosphate transport system, permease component
MIVALVIGISAAIYLSEYSRDTHFIRFIRVAILNLAGVPSIVFGLFGFGLFVIFFGWNVSLIAGWFTLGLMILPAIITRAKNRCARCRKDCAKVRWRLVRPVGKRSARTFCLMRARNF